MVYLVEKSTTAMADGTLHCSTEEVRRDPSESHIETKLVDAVIRKHDEFICREE